MSVHLIVGSGGSVGAHLRTILLGSGDRIFNTHFHPRNPEPTGDPVHWIGFDLMESSRDIPSLLHTMDRSPLDSLILFSHPTLPREKGNPPPGQVLSLLPALEGVKAIFDACLPFLENGTILSVIPALSALKAGGYMKARIYFGGLKGLLEEYSRTKPAGNPGIVTLELVHIPGESTPHIPPTLLERMARQTLSGTLPDSLAVARGIASLIKPTQSQRWMHGKTFRLPEGPFF
ncbi:MAG: hypothetical protein ACYDAM_04235 [Leptospirales bacterium]